MDFSLFYFANDSEELQADRYRLLLEGARFADENGFHAVWTPERHFHAFGGIYPNPSVTSAAVAAITKRVQIRAGSVVAPLHHPLRIAEEWSMVDNISGGRAGVSFASGWHPRDFSLDPANYADRRSILFERVERIRRLWRGEALEFTDGVGKSIPVKIFPPPVQAELPTWITSSGDIETFRSAGRIRAGILTHLLNQEPDELATKIAAYRQAAAAADPNGWTGHVAVMVHTFLGEDNEEIREIVRPSLTEYLRSSLVLVLDGGAPAEELSETLTPTPGDIEFLLKRAFERYFDNDGLLGSIEKARKVASRLRDLGVDEIACLIDFGLPADQVLSGLTYLDRLRRLITEESEAGA